MRLRDFTLLPSETTAFETAEYVGGWREGEPVLVEAHGDELWVRQGDLIAPAQATTNPAMAEMRVRRGLTFWLLSKATGRKLLLQSLDVAEEHRAGLSVAVDERIAEDMKARGVTRRADMPEALGWLREHFVMPHPEDGTDCFVLGRYASAPPDALTLLGAGWRVDVRSNRGTARLAKLVKLTRRNSPGRFALTKGNVGFHDASVGAQLDTEEQRALLDVALRDNGSYLRLWQEYGELEWRRSVDRAKALGVIHYSAATPEEGEAWVWRLAVEDSEGLAEFRERWRELEFGPDNQVEASAERPNWDDLDASDAFEGRPLRGKLRFEADALVVTPAEDRKTNAPPSQGYVYYSLSGDAAVRKRRQEAKQSIDQGRRMPQLRYLLEGVPTPAARRARLPALSPYAKTCFKGKPTARQESALDVALNTPDVALIIGPPGTGKTQVIAALQRRLAETMGEQSARLQVLISSFQHDAVDNALSRVDVFGLPPVRIGDRGRRSDGGIELLSAWCDRTREALTARMDDLEASEPYWRPLSEIHRKLLATRLAILSPDERAARLKEIDGLLNELEAMRIRLPPALRDRWRTFMDARAVSAPPAKEGRPELLRRARGLRVSPVGYADDGAENAHRLLRAFVKHRTPMHPDDKTLLDKLSYAEAASAEDLAAVADLRGRLIDGLRPDYRPPALKRAPEGEELNLLNAIGDALEVPVSESRKGIPAVVANFREALASSPERVTQTVTEYAAIVGATCQHAASGRMTSLKVAGGLQTMGVEFDTVVVDEAARANPLDLFVPMAMARRRIVLVGDHRQLPHLLQADLEDELSESLNLSEAQREAYRKSLFERMVTQFREREGQDGVKRVVVLDTQYRMHPVLGEFVSSQFYEPEVRIIPGRPASDFGHGVPWYEDAVCAWIDVPHGDGAERRGAGRSRCRDAEAQVAAQELKRIADAVGDSKSVGIITFYSAQRDRILAELEPLGMTVREDGELRIAREYRTTRDGEERVRVGTVDAFQGMEFDIVLLSVVRSSRNRPPPGTGPDAREAFLNAKYGHLRLPNRLNVAMSRQRSLLVALGDRGMAEGEEAREAVPALAAFLDLCRGEHGHGR